MKRTLMLLTSAFLMHSCQPDDTKSKKTASETIKPGVEILADSLPIAEDKLNNQHFSIHIYTNDSSVSGSYDVQTQWGYNIATTTMRMPYGGENYKPIIRRSSVPYTYIIGFNFEDDTTFREYYEVSGDRGQIKARYTHSYTLQ